MLAGLSFQLYCSTAHFLQDKKFCQHLTTFANIFPSKIIECFRLVSSICESDSVVVLKYKFLKFIRPFPNTTISYKSATRIKLIICLRLDLNHLLEYKCKISFQDSQNHSCNYGSRETQCFYHYLLYCSV